MSELPSIELAAALAIEGKRVLLGHWVEASAEPLQRGLEALTRLDAHERKAPAAQALAIEMLALLSLALDACARFDAAMDARKALELRLAEGVAPLGEAVALSFMSCAAQLRGDVTAMISLGERSLRLVQEREALPAAAPNHVLFGWALVMDGAVDEGIDALEAGLIYHRRHGSMLSLPWLLSVCAEARLAASAMDDARYDIEAAHAATSAHAGHGFMHAGAWRVRGNLRWAAGEGLAAASPDWQQALAIDRAAGALLCELQTTLVLGRALAASSRKAQARELLAGVLGSIDIGSTALPACPAMEIASRQLAAWS